MTHARNWLGLAALASLPIVLVATGAHAATAAAAHLKSHQAPLALDGGATAWMLTSTALVLFMTLPGLALFYGGMVRRKNVISTITQTVAVAAVVTILWFVCGYSLAFTTGTRALQPYVGGLDALFLDSLTPNAATGLAKTIPEALYVAYQLTFAMITPALICGAFAERMKFSALLLFMALWTVFVYAPIAHWVWGNGFLAGKGVIDFAGGAVVHVNAGVSGLVCALVLGPRLGFGRDNMAPHNLVLTMIGASMLFVGWIGFNAGSALAADQIASIALLNTMLAPMGGAVTWTLVEWIERKKPTLLGMLSGIVAGLVAITPAAGYVDPKGAMIIGLVSGPVCYAGAVWLKKALKYDDSLDAFGVHGVGGIAGALMTGAFASVAINPAGAGASVLKQALGLGATIAWSAIGAFVILMICKVTTGLRVTRDEEIEGLDWTLHGEALHD
ncbi:MAG TPA: ammonium transporter [Caulobacteraceae bacterium]|jgi:Amt family ammonium transporter|nr:ammonium transporter [Caulobacteraceae bacterium]